VAPPQSPETNSSNGDHGPAAAQSGSYGSARAASEHEPSHGDRPAWKATLAKYQRPSFWRATWQLTNSLGGYVVLWYLMYLSLGVSWWLTLPLAVLAGGLLLRVFIIFHDCGHGSFFTSRFANDFWGFITGLLTFTPYFQWRGDHAIHHGTAGDLDRRGVGDMWTMTVQEYLESSRWKRFAYRLARNSVVLFLIAPLVLFLFIQRFPRSGAKRRERYSVWWMNLAVLGMAAGASTIFGLVPYLVIQLSVLMVASSVGVWLFYVQHQFEGAYWERGADWDYAAAALQGSSFFKLPKVLQWFSGSIGFHHIHHLSPRIPNYNLQRCHEADPVFRAVRPMSFLGGLRALGLRLWDESTKKLVSFRHLRQLRKSRRMSEGQRR